MPTTDEIIQKLKEERGIAVAKQAPTPFGAATAESTRVGTAPNIPQDLDDIINQAKLAKSLPGSEEDQEGILEGIGKDLSAPFKAIGQDINKKVDIAVAGSEVLLAKDPLARAGAIASLKREVTAPLTPEGKRTFAVASSIVLPIKAFSITNKLLGPMSKTIFGKGFASAAVGSSGLSAYMGLIDGPDPKAAAKGAVLGAGFGFALPFGTKAVSTIATPVIRAGLDRLKSMPAVSQFTAQNWRGLQTQYHNVLTSGEEFLKKAGLGAQAQGLREARDGGASIGGGFIDDFNRNIKGLNDDEIKAMAGIVEKKMAPEELAVIKGIRPEKIPALLQAADQEKRRLQFVGQMLKMYDTPVSDPTTGGMYRFELTEDFLPHRIVNTEQFVTPGKIQTQAVDVLVNRKPRFRSDPSRKVKSKDDALEWLDEFHSGVEAKHGIGAGSINSPHMRGRTLDLPGYEQDMRMVLPQYYEFIGRRLAHAAKFGPIKPGVPAVTAAPLSKKAKKAAALKLTMAQEDIASRGLVPMDESAASVRRLFPRAFDGLDLIEDKLEREVATSIVENQLGKATVLNTFQDLLRKVSVTQVFSKLALAMINQPTQAIPALTRFGWKGAAGDFIKAFGKDPDAWSFGQRVGASLQGVVRESETNLMGTVQSDAASGFLRGTGFTFLDTASRVFGALRGKAFAENQAQRMFMLSQRANLTNRQSRHLSEIAGRFRELGIDPQRVLTQQGQLTDSQLGQAGRTAAFEANFWGDALSLPAFWKTPEGRFVTQFKSFAFQQSKLVKDKFVKPALKGKPGPLLQLIALSVGSGEIVADIKAILRNKQRPENLTERLLENFGQAAGFGLVLDALDATRRGQQAIFGFGVGPGASTVAKAFAAAGQIPQGNLKPTGKFLVRELFPLTGTPGAFIGPPLESALFPSTQRPPFIPLTEEGRKKIKARKKRER